jgi:hypothetical protein
MAGCPLWVKSGQVWRTVPFPRGDIQLAFSAVRFTDHLTMMSWLTEVHNGPNIFQRIGEFPNYRRRISCCPAAIDFYKNGPSFMRRHLPLWLSVHLKERLQCW